MLKGINMLSKDSKQAFIALFPLAALGITAFFNLGELHVVQGNIIDVLYVYGYINMNDTVPLWILTLLFGTGGYAFYFLGTTWAQLKAIANLYSIPWAAAAIILAAFGAEPAAAAAGLIGLAYVTVGA